MNFGRALLPLLLLSGPLNAQAQPKPATPTPQQAARVQVAQITAQVRAMQRAGLLRAANVAPACRPRNAEPMLQVWKDNRGVTRLIRYNQLYPDNTLNFIGYFDPSGRLRYAQGSASGFVGPLYNLTSEYDAQGKLVHESGYRREGWKADLKNMPGLNVAALARGECPR